MKDYISIGNIKLNKDLKKKFFLEHFEKQLIKTGSETLFVFKEPVTIMKEKFWVRIYFKDDKLLGLNLNSSDELLQQNYDKWSQHIVNKKRQIHDEWLKLNFGRYYEKNEAKTVYKLEYADVTSYTDMKSGEVGIYFDFKL